ncbi:uncharacterized protein LOC131077648 [Cryptomeria japonica]|uniref:uncharacterized protein LOC131077648 n=1 Tax=Cryptomeria japonica TaxID=3369 RepID=UPI0027DA0736|nr:uncharacterized protein LOC131077648 [Cryptomeria japonica]
MGQWRWVGGSCREVVGGGREEVTTGRRQAGGGSREGGCKGRHGRGPEQVVAPRHGWGSEQVMMAGRQDPLVGEQGPRPAASCTDLQRPLTPPFLLHPPADPTHGAPPPPPPPPPPQAPLPPSGSNKA